MTRSILERVKIRLKQYRIESTEDSDTLIFTELEENPALEVIIEQNKETILNLVNPPDWYSIEQREQILDKYAGAIVDMALYDYCKEGGEFQTSHTEGGITRSWENKSEIAKQHNIIPLSKIV